jgi:hypothetical protein
MREHSGERAIVSFACATGIEPLDQHVGKFSPLRFYGLFRFARKVIWHSGVSKSLTGATSTILSAGIGNRTRNALQKRVP